MYPFSSTPNGMRSTCDSAAADQVCEGHEEFWRAPEVGMQQGSYSLTQLIQ